MRKRKWLFKSWLIIGKNNSVIMWITKGFTHYSLLCSISAVNNLFMKSVKQSVHQFCLNLLVVADFIVYPFVAIITRWNTRAHLLKV